MARFCVHPDDDCPEFHGGGERLGPLVRRRATREERRVMERFLFEPGYAMAYLFLVAQPRDARESARKAA